MKKYIIYSISLFFLLFGTIKVKGQFDERLERFQAQKVAYYTERLKLTSDEAEKFWPVFNDYTNRKEKLDEESKNLLRYLVRNSDNMAAKEVAESLDKYVQIQDKSHNLFMEYHKKYLEILPPQKVARVYIVETQFKTFLLNQIREARPPERNPRRF